MPNAELLARGRAVRRELVGDVCADKLDREVYTDKHMEKFGDVCQEVLFAQLWTRDGLDLKTRSLITMICDTAQGSTDALALHVRFCRNHGWSEDEIIEGLIHCWPYIGVPRARAALVVATRVFNELQSESASAKQL
ncbi:carboxymuconolactone decarboxylase family protein [Azohydromonas australica]|uniref:carboxymuconolactone decarboxylase family protein n=1 Tax=Azohydromonas australica TaxID=364039 RepID=UPI000415E151|nr:carboxymuconolactone decarboxylase family protein [Azohydromonas australica]